MMKKTGGRKSRWTVPLKGLLNGKATCMEKERQMKREKKEDILK